MTKISSKRVTVVGAFLVLAIFFLGLWAGLEFHGAAERIRTNDYSAVSSRASSIFSGPLKLILWVTGVKTEHDWPQGTSPGNSRACSSKELTAVLKPADPVYAETMELTRELENHEFVVRCVLQSKMTNIFHNQLGAALYRTSRGDFEALFLTKPITFDSIHLVEQQQDGRYQYSFQGSPSSKGVMDCAKRAFFAKHANRMFITWDSVQLAADLGVVLNPS
jgi:hypothetical protein